MGLKEHLISLPYETERKICCTINTLLHLRPSSEPFLSADTYRKNSNAIYDETGKCSAKDITHNSIVYVHTRMLDDFISNILPDVKEKFILITHQSTLSITEKYLSLLENPLVLHWFAKNVNFEHEKLTPLPLGLEDQWRHNSGEKHDFKQLSKKNALIKKEKKILMGFNLSTNPIKRFNCYLPLWNKATVDECSFSISNDNYRKMLQKYSFVASPEGRGLDCHRTWEAMYLDVVPLVDDNYMNRYYKKLGVPLYIVNSWEEPANWTETDIENIYNETMKTRNLDTIFYPYWKTLINSKKEK